MEANLTAVSNKHQSKLSIAFSPFFIDDDDNDDTINNILLVYYTQLD